MYNKFFGFKEKPFRLVPNPTYLFLSKSHEEALAHLTYAISQGDGFVEITGEVGTGKTTLCRVFLENLDNSVEAAYIFNPRLDALQLLKAINDEFGIDSEPDNTKDLIDRLNTFLIEKKAAGHKVLVLIDEAQNLSLEVLEQLRLLSNLETTQDKLLQIILVGQPELGDMLSSYQLRQLGQRITINCQLTPLSFQETRDYIKHRITRASHRAGPPFDNRSLRVIYEYSRGIPRLINIACDRALLNAFGRNSFKITGAIAKEAIGELTRKKAKPSYNGLQGPTGVAIIAALFIPLVFALLYLANRDTPELPAVGSNPSAGQAEAPSVNTNHRTAGKAVPASSPTPDATTEQTQPPESLQAKKTRPVPEANGPAPTSPEEPGTGLTAAAAPVPELIAEKTKIVVGSPETEVVTDPAVIQEDIALYSVHAGTFPTFSQADERLAELKGMGFPSFMYTQPDSGGNTAYVVVAGKYQSYDLAEEAGRRLSRAGYNNFISTAKDSLVAGPTIVARQPETGSTAAEPVANKNTPEFLNYLRALNSRSSRNGSMEKILQLWSPGTDTASMAAGIDTDRVFFEKAAGQFGLQIQPVVTETGLALIESLNLPAIFTFYLKGQTWPKYLAVSRIDNEKVYFASDQPGRTVSADKEVLRQYWSGEAYIFWKNFNNLQRMITPGSRGPGVTALKALLHQLGYQKSSAAGDVYDSTTVQIIRDIQKKYRLHVDGMVGPLTKIVLYNESSDYRKPSLVENKTASTENDS